MSPRHYRDVAPQAVLRSHQVKSLEDRVQLLRALVWEGDRAFNSRASISGSLQDPLMRALGLAVTRHCPPRNDRCELQAIFDFTVRNVRYTGDVAGRDTFQSALRTLQFGGGDCLPLETLLFTDSYELKPLADIVPGDRVWSGAHWTQAQDIWVSGEKPLLSFELRNGCVLRCSPEHRVFLFGGEEIRAGDLRVGQRLTTPESAIPTVESAESQLKWSTLAPNDFAWLTGVYVSDGWWDKSRIAISGRDGKPKEAQKRRVVALMEQAGISTRWHERYVAVNDIPLANYFHQLGAHASQKHLPSLRFSRDQLPALIEGLRADGGFAESGTFVHSTTSPQLALELRVLYRMLGQSVHIRRVDDHGGLGSYPIYRVTVRRPVSEYKKPSLAKRFDGVEIVGIREDRTVLCGDLTVEGGRVWLPESDVVVHNCDDHSVLNALLAMENGFAAKFRITSNRGDTWDHIYAMAGLPKHSPKRWVALDTTLGLGRFGVEPPRAKYQDFIVGMV